MPDFTARIDADTIRCEITASEPLAAPVFCFSLMAPGAVVSGGTLIRSLGSWCEVALPDLAPGRPHEVVLRYAGGFSPKNRAWLPLGPYLRHAGGITPLPPGPAGVRPAPAPEPRPAEGLGLCPPPSAWAPAGGRLDLSRGIATSDEAFEAVAAIPAVSRLTEAPFLSPAGAPLMLTEDPSLPPEGYRLTIAPGGLTLAASARAGRFYGAVTLRQLQIVHGDSLPTGEITDAPRFGWRGQHLDCARHFFEVETIRDLLGVMALYKLNRFHWHFADDEAFRLEVSSYPELWQKTAFRGEGEALPGLFGGGPRAGGSYSKDDARALIDHAKRLNIEILPELEIPAHALALNAAIPGLRDPADNGAETSVQGYRGNSINPALPKMWEVTEALTAEVAELFPFGHLHLGCDELPEGTWEGSPAAAELKEREGLETTDDLQGWTMARLAAGLAAQGIRPAAWEEAARGAQGGIGNGAILFSWTGQGPGLDAARAGYDVVMCPGKNAYFDMAHSADPDDWGAAWAAIIPLEETVAWQPVPPGAEDVADRIIGVEGCFWGEFTTRDAELWPMILPRMLGIATKGWSDADGPALRALAEAHAAALAGPWGWHYGA
ncbi:beta-N-acetylhexosaminidase [Pseudoroseicyclus sp. CXY001]|uniref:beta-N-acetylhexosaminidase n=1 Tax=Pseudoroseicyclus sp. CXY001 TaxID=3242492 RepID=UPI0035714151